MFDQRHHQPEEPPLLFFHQPHGDDIDGQQRCGSMQISLGHSLSATLGDLSTTNPPSTESKTWHRYYSVPYQFTALQNKEMMYMNRTK